jgi:tRNA A-37 threonylcarbamoyl transferase component Bud32
MDNKKPSYISKKPENITIFPNQSNYVNNISAYIEEIREKAYIEEIREKIKNNFNTIKLGDTSTLFSSKKYIYKIDKKIKVINECEMYKYINQIPELKEITCFVYCDDKIIVLEKCGESIYDILQSNPYRLLEIPWLFEVLFQNIQLIHINGICHCDLHVGNILLKDGKNYFIDFAHSKYDSELLPKDFYLNCVNDYLLFIYTYFFNLLSSSFYSFEKRNQLRLLLFNIHLQLYDGSKIKKYILSLEIQQDVKHHFIILYNKIISEASKILGTNLFEMYKNEKVSILHLEPHLLEKLPRKNRYIGNSNNKLHEIVPRESRMRSVNNKSHNKMNRNNRKTAQDILRNYSFRTHLRKNLPNHLKNNSNKFLSSMNEFFLFEFILFQYILEI